MVALPNPIRVLLVDDEDIVRYGLKMVAQCKTSQCDVSIEIVGEASTGKAAIAQAERLQPDVILMDIQMPEMDGIEATSQICQMQPAAKVLILTTHSDDRHLLAAMQQGAIGYLLKNTPPEDFIQMIQATHKGYMQISPGLGAKLLQQLQFPAIQRQPEQAKTVTPREQEVVQLIAKGATNREIARFLHITEKTVKNHVSSILSRLDLRDRTQIAIWANNAGLELVHS
ncbi:response regulator transcription factor [filamentous cyanobacterium LEGE 11480]|uniref:Response regulator transcription factor n=2 Tax=Romeriopsis TaxID=2992131 RepID=A0A928VP58_9CYAN|nr:response regulator transcription factor [Romeriopsis navalis LEGE 11480]